VRLQLSRRDDIAVDEIGDSLRAVIGLVYVLTLRVAVWFSLRARNLHSSYRPNRFNHGETNDKNIAKFSIRVALVAAVHFH